jgi:hypothetical protein
MADRLGRNPQRGGAEEEPALREAPKLRRAHERALAATWDLYRAVGALAADVREGT